MKKKKLFVTKLDKKWEVVAGVLVEESRRAKEYAKKNKGLHKEL